MKKNITIAATAITAIMFSACSNVPKPSANGKKPTIYVKSLTAEKYKEINTSNYKEYIGLSQVVASSKNYYMRCDMSDEARAIFGRYGFELVNDDKSADYTFEVEVVACFNSDKSFLKDTNKIMVPGKYYNMPSDDIETLDNFYAKYPEALTFEDSSSSTPSYRYVPTNAAPNGGISMITQGARISSSGSGVVGGIGIVLGIFTSFGGGDSKTYITNKFKIINNKTKKTWGVAWVFNAYYPKWSHHLMYDMDRGVTGEIPWKDLD